MDILTREGAVERITAMCRSEGQFHIATPNPEMLVEAAKNDSFKTILKNTAMNIPDGIGLVWAMRKKFRCLEVGRKTPETSTLLHHTTSKPLHHTTTKPRIERITGTDLLQSIIVAESRLCPPERIFLLGGAPGIAEKAAEELKRRNPAITEIGTYSGSPKEEDAATIIARIKTFSPTLLFVAYGAPKQDLWIAKNLAKMPSVKIAMGVGGAFDFLAGKRRRAPRWMQNLGIEWLWRRMMEPKRVLRIWRAVVVFPWLFIFYESRNHASD